MSRDDAYPEETSSHQATRRRRAQLRVVESAGDPTDNAQCCQDPIAGLALAECEADHGPEQERPYARQLHLDRSRKV